MNIVRLVVGSLSVNCYIVDSAGEGVVIDPGGDPDRICGCIAGIKIRRIALTHGHPDHIAAVSQVKQLQDAPVYIHKDDEPYMSLMYIGGIIDLGALPPAADYNWEDGDTFDIGDVAFRVIHTPGHTRGGVCLYGGGVLFGGDTLFAGSVGRTDIGGGNHKQIISSIKEKLLVLPDDTRVLPGHGPETTIGMERATNPFLTGL